MKFVFLFPLLFVISACSVGIPKEGSVVSISAHPPHDQLNNLIIPTPPVLSAPVLDIPKDSINKPIAGSNIYRGYDFDNFTKMQSNEFTIREYIRSLLGIIFVENSRRESNRQENAKWQAQTEAKKDSTSK